MGRYLESTWNYARNTTIIRVLGTDPARDAASVSESQFE